MHSLTDKFDELCARLEAGRRLENTGDDPIYYLVFPVREILKVKRLTPAWRAKLENKGWNVFQLSMARTVNQILQDSRQRSLWLESEREILENAEAKGLPIDPSDINKSLRNELERSGRLLGVLGESLEQAGNAERGLLIITDLEAIHPYLRINTLESKVQGRVTCPVVILYPGRREGKTSLRFLEFYPADPNYRSEHIG